MTDAFISYSRRDSEFVARLADAMRAREREVWVDVQGIEDAEVFPAAIAAAIEQADSFIYVITPDAAASRYCTQEVEHASELGKRIIPVLRAPVPDEALHPEIRDRNWIQFQDDAAFDPALERLLAACDRDLDHAKRHTRLLVRAREWDARGRDRSLLLRGGDLTEVSDWLDGVTASADPQPTELQRAFVLASRQASRRRSRILVGALAAGLVAAIVLVVIALISRSQAVDARTTARAQADASAAEADLGSEPRASLVLATRAVRLKPLPSGLFALRNALDAPTPLGEIAGPAHRSVGCDAPGPASRRLIALYRPHRPQLLTVDCAGNATIRDAATGRVVLRRRVGAAAASAAYSTDGRLLAIGAGGGVHIIDAATLEQRAVVAEPAPPTAVAISPDDRSIAASLVADGSVEVVSQPIAGGPASGRVVFRAPASGGPPGAIAYTGRAADLLIPTGTGAEVVDAASGRLLRRIAARGGGVVPVGESAAVSPDGRLAAFTVYQASGAGVAELYRVDGWRFLRTITSVPQVVLSSLAFSPDSSRIAVGAQDGSGGVWLTAVDQRLMSFTGQTTGLSALSFSADGSRVVSTSDAGDASIWRARGPESFDAPSGFPAAFTQLADTGRTVVALGPTKPGGQGVEVHTWRASDGAALGSIKALRGFTTLSPDGKAILSVSGHPPVTRVISLSGGRVSSFPFVNAQQAAFAPGDRRIALYGFPIHGGGKPLAGTILNAGSQRRIPMQTPRFPIDWGQIQLSFSPDGRYAVGAELDGYVDLWNAATGALVRRFSEGGQVSGASIDARDRYVLVGSWDGVASLWNLRTGTKIGDFVGHTAGITASAFSPDARDVVTASLDGSIRIWDRDSRHELRRYELPSLPVAMAIAPDGSSIAISNHNGIVSSYDLCTDCRSPRGLLKLSAERGPFQLTARERAAIAGG